jgi:hypothetical protein
MAIKPGKSGVEAVRRMLACTLVIATLPTLAAQRAWSWNATGHKVIASIAYARLDESTRRRVASVLEHHPARKALWMGREGNSIDERLNLLWNASIFPDDARGGEFARFNRPRAHYVNSRILAEEENRVEPPVAGENILNSHAGHLKKLADLGTAPQDAALHLSWLLHQTGDIHQPLHAVARFSAALPEGDRGGNEVRVPNPRGRGEQANNLHAYWDDLLGTDENPESIARLATEIADEYPVETFAAEFAKMRIGEWAEESVTLALNVVYRDLDANIVHFDELPVAYQAEARAVARRRIALAGYRLAAELERLYSRDAVVQRLMTLGRNAGAPGQVRLPVGHATGSVMSDFVTNRDRSRSQPAEVPKQEGAGRSNP